MSSKPKKFSEAIEDLEQASTSAVHELKDRLKTEIRNLEDKIEELKPQLDALKNQAQKEAKRAKDGVERQLKANPWRALGIVGLVGLVAGFLCAFLMRDRD